MGHGTCQRPDRQGAMVITEQDGTLQRRTAGGRRPGVKGARAQRPLERGPAGRRMAMIDMGGGPEETVAADLALEGALGQVGMGLPGGFAFDAGKFDPVAHQVFSCSTPRRIWSASMLSNRAR